MDPESLRPFPVRRHYTRQTRAQIKTLFLKHAVGFSGAVISSVFRPQGPVQAARKKKYPLHPNMDASFLEPRNIDAVHDWFDKGGRVVFTAGSTLHNQVLKSNSSSMARYKKRSRPRRAGKRKSKRRKRSTSRKKGLKRLVKKVSLSLCEPKQLRSIEEQQVLGHNIPHFYTGGLNMGFMPGRESSQTQIGDQQWCWQNQFNGTTQPTMALPVWRPLRGDGVTGASSLDCSIPKQKPIGKYCVASTSFGDPASNDKVIFRDNDTGIHLDRMMGNEICPSKLTYQITFRTGQNFSVLGTNATYVCVLFRYKVSNQVPDVAQMLPSNTNPEMLVDKACNMLPRSNVGWNPWLRCNHVFSGMYNAGASFDNRSRQYWNKGNLPVSGDGGTVDGQHLSLEQLTSNCSLQRKNFSVVQTKKFRFSQAFPTPTDPQVRGTPTHTHTVFLTHRFKPGSKLKYSYMRLAEGTAQPDPVPEGGSSTTLTPNLQPDGYNYGVLIYACGEEIVHAPDAGTPGTVKVPENWQWTDLSQTSTDLTDGRLCTYDIKKSFYYKDP